MFDYHCAVARTTNIVIGSRVASPNGGIRFSVEIIPTSSAFTPIQASCFGSLHYIVDHCGELQLFKKTSLEDNKTPTSYHPFGLPKDLGCVGLTDPPRFGPELHHVETPSHVLCISENPSPNHH